MKRFLSILLSTLLTYLCYSQSSYNNNYEDLFIEKNVFTIKSRHTHYSSFPLISMFQGNKYIKIPITGNLVNEDFEIENCSLYIFDTTGNRIYLSSSIGDKCLGYEKKIKIKKIKPVDKVIRFNKEKRKMTIKMALRYVVDLSCSVFREEYGLKKGKYYFYLEYYNMGNETIRSNKAVLLVK